jgi:hypothetical protein
MKLAWILALSGCWTSHERPATDAGSTDAPIDRDAGRDVHPPLRCDPARWTHEVVDTDEARFGGFAVAYGPDGALHVLYAKRRSRVVHALRTASGFARDDASAQATVYPGTSTLDAVVTSSGVHAVYFGPGPDTPATALWHATSADGEWRQELVTPWGRLYNRTPAPHVSVDALDDQVGIAYRGLVDHVVWATAGDAGVTDEVQPMHAPGSIATAFASDGRRAIAFTERDFVYDGGRLVAAIRRLELRFGARVESRELSRRDADELAGGCGASGVDVLAAPDTLEVYFGDPDAALDRCELRHATLRDGAELVVETLAVPASVVSVARSEGRTHLVAAGSRTAYASRTDGAWSLEDLPFEVSRARIAATSREVAIAFTRGEEFALELATAPVCPL